MDILKDLMDLLDKKQQQRAKERTPQQRDRDEQHMKARNEAHQLRIDLTEKISGVFEHLFQGLDSSKALADAVDELQARLVEKNGRISELNMDLDKRVKELYLTEELLRKASEEVAELKALLKDAGIDPEIKKPVAPATRGDGDQD